VVLQHAGNGPVLAKCFDATDDRFPARPKGGAQMSQYCVAALKKGRAILCCLRLVLKHLGTSESVVITWKEH